MLREGSQYPKVVFYFEGVKGDVEELETDNYYLYGGVGASEPEARVTTVREGAEDTLLFEPIVS